jgi:hypothetical protein
LSSEKKKKENLKSRGTILSIIAVILLIMGIGFYGDELIGRFTSASRGSEDVQLTVEEEGFVDKLLEEWSQDFHITNIQQVALNDSVKYDHDMRYRITSYLAKNPKIHRQLMVWHLPTFALTNDEKRVAKFILMRNKAGTGIPAMEEMKKALGLDKDTIDEAFFILYQLGFLDRGKVLKIFPGAYSLSPDHENHVPEWSLHYTEIVREDGRRFNVQCFLDALKMIYEDFIGEKVTVNTYCPDCLQPITVVASMGQVIDTEPNTTVILKGGTCPTNLAFISAGHLKRWAADHPEIKDRNPYFIDQLLDSIKEER